MVYVGCVDCSSVDLPFAESKVNISWPQVLKATRADLEDFYEKGGWMALGEQSSDGEESEEESASEYEMSDLESEVESESEVCLS
jgi:nucleosome binding factor SPN SPT16 subunit